MNDFKKKSSGVDIIEPDLSGKFSGFRNALKNFGIEVSSLMLDVRRTLRIFLRISPVLAGLNCGDTIQPTNKPSGETVCDVQPPLVDLYSSLGKAVQQCTSCHVLGKYGSPAWFWPEDVSDPVGLQEAFKRFAGLALLQTVDGEPWIVEYAQGKIPKVLPNGTSQMHPGGQQPLSDYSIAKLKEFSAEVVEEFQQEGELPVVNTDCDDGSLDITDEEYYDGVEFLDDEDVLRKFIRTVAGGPLPDNLSGIKNREDLINELRKATNRIGFYNWLLSSFNDITLTRFYDEGNSALGVMGDEYGFDWSSQGFANADVADAPQFLLAFIVWKNRRIKELLTASYILVPGQHFENQSEVPDPNKNWLQDIQILYPDVVDANGVSVVVSGIFSHPLWLATHSTSDTNLNNGRAWKILKDFWDLNVLDIVGSQNIQIPPGISLPTVRYGPCLTCHADTDPPFDSVAAALLDFQGGRFEYNPQLPPRLDLPITLGDETIPKNSKNRLGEMMKLMTAEPSPPYHFSRAMAKLAFRMLMGRMPVKAPKPEEADYVEKMRRFKVEDAFFDEMAQVLRDNDYNFRELIIEIAASPWFAATGGITKPLSQSRRKELEFVGPGMIGPEVFALRLRQLFGDAIADSSLYHKIFDDYLIELGGIDSKKVKKRLDTPNAAYELALTALAFEAGKFVVTELADGPDKRHLFKYLDFGPGMIEPPRHPGTKKPIPDNEEKYRLTFARIQLMAFGKILDVNSPEVTAEYEKWLAIWEEFLIDTGSGQIAGAHKAEGMSQNDTFGLVRAWEAYITSVVMSPEFNR